MDKFIKKLKVVPLSGDDMMRIVDGNTKVITYKELNNFNNIDDVLKPHGSVVLLYERKPNNGHWVGLIKHPGKIEFYDPYGFGIDEQFKILRESGYTEGVNGNDEQRLTKLLLDSPYKIVENKGRVQKLSDGVNSCGRHVGFRINMKDMPLNKFVGMLKGGKMSADDTITYLTAFV
jgi:hypothetical protein